jgi:hypothetical protein
MALTKKQAEANAKKEINIFLKFIKEDAHGKIKKALNSGAISENSDFMEKNSLLALTVLEVASEPFKIKSDYRLLKNRSGKYSEIYLTAQ